MNATAALAVIGHNNPPEPTPFERAEAQIIMLFDEAKNWLDGEGIATQAQADDVSKLLDMIRKAKKAADEARVEEKRPHDEAAKEVQEKYKPLLTRCDLAADAAKKALAPFLEKLEAEKRAKAEAARREAEGKARAAQEAIRAAQATDLAAREAAEALIQDAKKAEAVAKRAENDKAHGKGGSRAVTLRTTYRPVLKDAREAARYYWKTRQSELEAFLLTLAEKDVRAGQQDIPGFDIIVEKVAV
ncbi:hypothetical protein [Microvirga zambiensis]|uniref:hypothetical protein n=1 Tax=Microvirga zambiensis TaxID=1402137 RepID=UPI00191EE082|nr:hypothetical protein [Microvirga zambiensis]